MSVELVKNCGKTIFCIGSVFWSCTQLLSSGVCVYSNKITAFAMRKSHETNKPREYIESLNPTSKSYEKNVENGYTLYSNTYTSQNEHYPDVKYVIATQNKTIHQPKKEILIILPGIDDINTRIVKQITERYSIEYKYIVMISYVGHAFDVKGSKQAAQSISSFISTQFAHNKIHIASTSYGSYMYAEMVKVKPKLLLTPSIHINPFVGTAYAYYANNWQKELQILKLFYDKPVINTHTSFLELLPKLNMSHTKVVATKHDEVTGGYTAIHKRLKGNIITFDKEYTSHQQLPSQSYLVNMKGFDKSILEIGSKQ